MFKGENELRTNCLHYSCLTSYLTSTKVLNVAFCQANGKGLIIDYFRCPVTGFLLKIFHS